MNSEICVAVAMSGGVDSSTAAYLLLEQGYRVIGLHMRLTSEKKDQSSTSDAEKVAKQLNLPFYEINLEEIFKKEVIDVFVQEYLSGRTPNPCLICNKKIKFQQLLLKAQSYGAEYLATGHYARIAKSKSDLACGATAFKLLKGIDQKYDQSYFLFSLNQTQLSQILFPLGNMNKSEVRKIAQKANLPVATKRGSQDVCFIPDHDYGNFIKLTNPQAFKPGPIINSERKILGSHKGFPLYTIGKRRGLGIAASNRLYVTKILAAENTIVVGSEKELLCSCLEAKNPHWIASIAPSMSDTYTAKIRYNHKGEAAQITLLTEDKLQVKFQKPVKAVAPGQAVVFYKDEELLGGAWIEKGICIF